MAIVRTLTLVLAAVCVDSLLVAVTPLRARVSSLQLEGGGQQQTFLRRSPAALGLRLQQSGSSSHSSSSVRLAATQDSSSSGDGSSLSLKARLSAAGRGGLVAYGILNWIYYITVTIVAWNFSSVGVSAAPVRAAVSATSLAYNQRVSASLLRLGKVMGIVWAGSQITKPTRITGAILLSPVADRLLLSLQRRLGLPSVERAFGVVVGLLLGSTALFYALTVFGSALLLR